MSDPVGEGTLTEIPIREIRIAPENVRSPDRARDVEELAESISRLGLLQPLVITREDGHYLLIVGQRRLRAIEWLRTTGKWPADKKIPVLLCGPLNPSERVLISLTENLERHPLTFSETLRAVGRLMEFYRSVKRVAKAMGVSRPTVYKYISMDSLPREIQHLVDARKITQADARRSMAAAGGDPHKAAELAKRLPALRAGQRSKIVALGTANPGASASEIIKLASAAEKEVRVTIVLPKSHYSKLVDASSTMRLDPASIAARAVVEWLSQQGY